MTITLRCATEFPVGLSRGAQNGQAADATVVEQIERALSHLFGRRRQSVPLWCHPRVITSSATYELRVRRPSWTASATLRVIYDTITPWDWWTLSIGGESCAVPPSPAYGSVSGAQEIALPFELGTGASAAVSQADLTMTLAFARRDPAFTGAISENIRVYSAFLSIEPMDEVTQ